MSSLIDTNPILWLMEKAKPHIDCDGTFSKVIKRSTIHTILSLTLSRPCPIHHLDEHNTFLHSSLQETVQIHQPPRLVDSHHPDYVCHVKNSLYGQNHAFHRFATYAQELGFSKAKLAFGLFFKVAQTSLIYWYILILMIFFFITGVFGWGLLEAYWGLNLYLFHKLCLVVHLGGVY